MLGILIAPKINLELSKASTVAIDWLKGKNSGPSREAIRKAIRDAKGRMAWEFLQKGIVWI
jgi:hypothetical protein